MADLREALASGVEATVMRALSPHGRTGISVSVIDEKLVIAITKGAEGMCVALPFAAADDLCNLIADKFLSIAPIATLGTETVQ